MEMFHHWTAFNFLQLFLPTDWIKYPFELEVISPDLQKLEYILSIAHFQYFAIYHLPALQPDVEAIRKLLPLHSSPSLGSFISDERQNKSPGIHFFVVWGQGRQAS